METQEKHFHFELNLCMKICFEKGLFFTLEINKQKLNENTGVNIFLTQYLLIYVHYSAFIKKCVKPYLETI